MIPKPDRDRFEQNRHLMQSGEQGMSAFYVVIALVIAVIVIAVISWTR